MPSQNPSPAYVHSLTTAFTSTLDEIPQDMCRHFADLRELDAVLSHNLNVITKRIEELTDKIEGGLNGLESLDPPVPGNSQDENPDIPRELTPKEERASVLFQWLLAIADDTTRIKLGGEDKIRVASLAADHMNAYYNHLLGLVRRMHDMDDAYALNVIAPYTAYPHVSPSSLVDPLPDNRRHLRRPGATQRVYNASYPQGSQDTPNKRKRLHNGQAGINQSHVRGDVDTDEYSTPRRGVTAIDEEAYRPGGNTASKAKATKPKKDIRHSGQQQPTTTTDMNAMGRSTSTQNPGTVGIDPMGGMYVQPPASSSHKSHKQTGHGKSDGGALPSAGSQPPVMYSGYSAKNTRIFVSPYDSLPPPFDAQMPGYPQTANMNPVMEAYHHSAMNMNPNISQHFPPGAYAHPIVMPIPSTLPPPPSASGRPSSSSISGKNVYDAHPAGSLNNSSRQSLPSGSLDTMAGGPPYPQGSMKGSSRANEAPIGTKERDSGNNPGGLVPLPMMTHLPPMNSLTQPTALNVGPHSQSGAPADPTQSRPRGYSTQSYGGYGGPEQAYTSNSHSGYQQPPSSSSTYPSSSAGGPLVEKARTDVHPSLASSKDLPPLNTHVRDIGLGSAGISGSGSMHTSLPRDPPYRTNSAGSGDRSERDMKPSNAPSRPRSGTVGGAEGSSMPTSSTKYRDTGGDQEFNQMTAPNYSTDHRSLASGGFASRHPSLRSGPNSAGPTTSHPSHGHSQSQASRYGYGDPIQKADDREVTTPLSAGGSKRISHAKEDRESNTVERYNHGRTGSGRGIKTDDVIMADPMEDKPFRTPVRRKTGEEPIYRLMESGGSGTADSQTLDEDSKLYCICGQQSFGEMIGCDDSECEIEWFHLQCLGLDSPPPGQDIFVCPQCRARRAKGTRKPGKKKGNGGGKGRGM
ncbi:hypothetical protein FS842_008392 [Serendipita sp. 407]|nr:hypothetical protein FS842_008392 [Serendipita sp. 407]